MPGLVRFPALEMHPIALATGDPLARLAAAMGSAPAAYLRLDQGTLSRFLFVQGGRTHSAGSLTDGRVSAGRCEEFVQALPSAQSAVVCLTDLPLFLCALVSFRKPPARRIAARLFGAKSLLQSVRDLGRDSVLVVKSPEVWSLAFCEAGEPVRLYPAPGEVVPGEAPIPEQIGALVRAHPDCSVDLYDDVRLPPAADANRELLAYRVAARAAMSEATRTACLLVRLEDREVFRYPLGPERVRIGRGGEKEIALDNASVSRDHAEVLREGDHHVIRDLGSVNGVMARGSRVSMLRLTPGAEVTIGVYTLVYLDSPDEAAPASPSPASSGSAAIGPTLMLPGNETGVIEWEGARHEMRGPFFFIGSGKDAHLRLDGEAVAPRHVLIIREPAGGFRITRGLEAGGDLVVNGERVTERFLRDGDEVTVGKHLLRFRIEPTAKTGRKI